MKLQLVKYHKIEILTLFLLPATYHHGVIRMFNSNWYRFCDSFFATLRGSLYCIHYRLGAELFHYKDTIFKWVLIYRQTRSACSFGLRGQKVLYVGGKFYLYNSSTGKIVCYPNMWTTCDSIYSSNDLPNLGDVGSSAYDYKGNPYNDVDLNYDETGEANLWFLDCNNCVTSQFHHSLVNWV